MTEFSYHIHEPTKEGFPSRPAAYIFPKTSTKLGDEDLRRMRQNSRDLRTEIEIDEYVQELKQACIEDLNHVARDAKRALQQAVQRERERIRDKRAGSE